MSPATFDEVCIEKSKDRFQFRRLKDFPLMQGFGSRSYDAVLRGDEASLRNRERFCESFGISLDEVVSMEQIHSNNIMCVSAKHKGRGARSRDDQLPNVDGIITRDRNVVLTVRTADCAPVLFYDTRIHAAGIAHVGWRASLMDLTGKMIMAFQNNFASRSEDIIIAFGPMIHSCCYEVGKDFKETFGDYLEERDSRYYLDLPRVISMQLDRVGVKPDNILDSNLCTACNQDLFFSYRLEGPEVGRIFSIIMLK